MFYVAMFTYFPLQLAILHVCTPQGNALPSNLILGLVFSKVLQK